MQKDKSYRFENIGAGCQFKIQKQNFFLGKQENTLVLRHAVVSQVQTIIKQACNWKSVINIS